MASTTRPSLVSRIAALLLAASPGAVAAGSAAPPVVTIPLGTTGAALNLVFTDAPDDAALPELARAHLAFIAAPPVDWAARADPGETDVTPAFRHPSDPWQLGPVETACPPDARCQSPLPDSYRRITVHGMPALLTGDTATPKGSAVQPGDAEADRLYQIRIAGPTGSAPMYFYGWVDPAEAGLSRQDRIAVQNALAAQLQDISSK